MTAYGACIFQAETHIHRPWASKMFHQMDGGICKYEADPDPLHDWKSYGAECVVPLSARITRRILADDL